MQNAPNRNSYARLQMLEARARKEGVYSSVHDRVRMHATTQMRLALDLWSCA